MGDDSTPYQLSREGAKGSKGSNVPHAENAAGAEESAEPLASKCSERSGLKTFCAL
jgi:hypothetical protein